MIELSNTRRHPLSGAFYGVDPAGHVHVDLAGQQGIFEADGTWISGPLREADPHLCGWLAGPQLPPGMAALPKDLPVEAHRS